MTHFEKTVAQSNKQKEYQMLIYLASTVLMSKPEKIRKMINFECFKSTKEWSLQIFENKQN